MMRQVPEKLRWRHRSPLENSGKTSCPEDGLEKNLWNRQVGKTHPPAGQLVSRPRTQCTTFLGLVSVIPVIPTKEGESEWRDVEEV